MNLEKYFKTQTVKIEKALKSYLPRSVGTQNSLYEAMSYSVLNGGKRIRPILTLAAAHAVGGNEKKVMPAACAIELIHNYSLIHDDLPCMDNDDTRRGLPTCHKKYGEVTALLAGDGLLTLAFQCLSAPALTQSPKDAKRYAQAAFEIAKAAGVHGMVLGQAVDMEYQSKPTDLATLEYINTRKTGALIAVCLKVGAYLGSGSASQTEALYRYGKSVGFLFQIVDDILDGDGYAKILGLSEAKKTASKTLATAKSSLKRFGSKAETLLKIADFVYERKY